ncbi:hypothetical protein K8I28_07010 [bacterium]|nr:hypothetical protein [bacterium]
MSIEIGWFNFDGPYEHIEDFPDAPGVFVVLCKSGDSGFVVIDVDEGADIKQAIATHERRECWKDNCWGKYFYAAIYPKDSTNSDRLKLAREIRMQYHIPCGEEVHTKPFGEPKPWTD